MSKIQDLIDLKLMHSTGEFIYEKYEGSDAMSLLKQGIMLLSAVKEDPDPEIYNGYGIAGPSVTVSYGFGMFKSHECSGSYGGTEWTDWAEVEPVPKIEYHYVESAY